MKFTKKEEHDIGLYFHISIAIKAIISIAEIIVGILVLIIPISYFTHLAVQIAQSSFIQSYAHFIGEIVISHADQLTAVSSGFIAAYLLSRGLVKVGLITALLKNKLWAYPLSLIVLSLFLIYQLYQIYMDFSGFIIALTIFDLIVMWFIWEEYQVLKSKKN